MKAFLLIFSLFDHLEPAVESFASQNHDQYSTSAPCFYP